MQNTGACDSGGDRTYLVGQDRAGRWLAMEERGRGGGMFSSREAAIRFAGSETDWREGAVSEPGRPIAFA